MPSKIRLALIGIGNCASSFLQGLQYYSEDDSKPGLWHVKVGGYAIADLEVVTALDIDSRKIGLDVANAAFTRPNVAQKHMELKPIGVSVKKGILKDSLSSHLRNLIDPLSGSEEELLSALREDSVDIVVNLISSGLDDSSRAYALASLNAGCSFVNATPSVVASDPSLSTRFSNSKLVLAGDDLLSQFGGTAFHKGILDLMHSRSITILRSYQLDVGGGAETLNTLDERIRGLKREMKSSAIAVELPYEVETVAGTTDYVDYMQNNRTSYFLIEGRGFLGSEARVDIYLRTSDGPNAGNVLFDLIRAVKAAKDRGEYGAVPQICSYGFKKSPRTSKLGQAQAAFAVSFVG